MTPLETATRPRTTLLDTSLDAPHTLVPAQEMQRPLAAREVLDRFSRIHAISKKGTVRYAGGYAAVASGGAWLATTFGTRLSWPIPAPQVEHQAWVYAAMATALGAAALVGGGYGLVNNLSKLLDPTQLWARSGREYYYRLGGYTNRPALSDRLFGKPIHAVDHPSQLQDIPSDDHVLLNDVLLETVKIREHDSSGRRYYSVTVTASHAGQSIIIYDTNLSRQDAYSCNQMVGQSYCLLGTVDKDGGIAIQKIYDKQLSVVGKALAPPVREQGHTDTNAISPDILYDMRLDEMHDDTKRDLLIQVFRKIMTLGSQDQRRWYILVLCEKLGTFKNKDYRWPVILEILSYLKHPQQEYREDAWSVISQMKKFLQFTSNETEHIDAHLVRVASETDNADAKLDIDLWLRGWRV